MIDLKMRQYSAILTLTLLTVTFQNCSEVGFSPVNEAKKSAVLEETNVLITPPRLPTGEIAQPGNPATPGWPVLPANPSVPGEQVMPPVNPTEPGVQPSTDTPWNTGSASNASIEFFNGLQCDPTGIQRVGGIFDPIFKDSQVQPTITVTDTTNNSVVCSIADRESLLTSGHSISLKNCNLVENRKYLLSGIATLPNGQKINLFALYNPAAPLAQYSLGPVEVTFSKKNSSATPTLGSIFELGFFGFWQNCTGGNGEVVAQAPSFASPLIVDLRSREDERSTIQISSLMEGIYFDILGANGHHIPKRIGWTSDARYAFIALPDINGQVTGIDQLFGNNTRGPDGEFSENGFTALAKHDDNKDGLITAQDSVFNKLRLWSDLNYNGRAESNELRSLSEGNLDLIDLKYDANYRERDQYGNETTFKSIVRHTDGRYSLIFDIWFVYAD